MNGCDSHPFTRRQFLHGSLAMISTVATVPVFLEGASRALAAMDGTSPNLPGVPAGRVLVIVQLSGGNDGLNTVIPFAQQAYHDARPRIGVGDDQVLKLDGLAAPEGIGLHPSLLPVREMMQQQRAAIIQGVGYPNPNRSHFTSMDIWHRGDALTQRGYGWIGKAFDSESQRRPQADHNMDVIAIGGEAPLAVEGKQANAIAFERQDVVRWIPHARHAAPRQKYAPRND